MVQCLTLWDWQNKEQEGKLIKNLLRTFVMHVHLCNIGHVYTLKEDQERLLEGVKVWNVMLQVAGGIKTAGESIKHGSGDPANWGEEGWDWEDLAASCLPWIDVARLGSRSPAFLAFCNRICWECMLSPGRLWCFCFILQMVEVILVSLALRLCLTAWVQLGT